MLLGKTGVCVLVWHCSGLDLFHLTFGDGPGSQMFNLFFDLFICGLFFAVWRIIANFRNLRGPKWISVPRIFAPARKFR
jgi:hypothetical protein